METDRGIELISRKSKATIARLSQAAAERWVSRTKDIREVHVVAMVQRTKDDVTDAEFRAHVAADRWEYPICEVVVKET